MKVSKYFCLRGADVSVAYNDWDTCGGEAVITDVVKRAHPRNVTAGASDNINCKRDDR